MHQLVKPVQRPFTATHKPDEHQIPDGLWHKCRGCRAIIYTKQWLDNIKVCPQCGHHERLSASEWIALLLDPGSWQEYDAELMSGDPLRFVSPKDNYAKKLVSLHASLGRLDAVICGTAAIEGLPLVLCVSEFGFMGGSMGSVVGEKIARSAERASTWKLPLVTINASGGARMHEGIFSLMQMAKVILALNHLGRAGQPHISVLTDPCYGGVMAAHGSAADVIVAEPGAHIGFAGPRVIVQTIRQELSPSFQTAESLLERGMVDMVTPRHELRDLLGRLLQLYTSPWYTLASE